jgi:hypothetical protein
MKHNTAFNLTAGMILLILLVAACNIGPASKFTETVYRTPTVVAIQTADTITPQPLVFPQARGYHSMAFDVESRRVILFGGNTANPMLKRGPSNETWSFDPSSEMWKKMSPPSSPEGFSGDMTYVHNADRVILLLNTDPATPNYFDYQSTQTWMYDYNTDTWLKLADGPSGRVGLKIAYDSESDKIILFGGFSLTTNQFLHETWAYDLSSDTWTQMQPANSPEYQNYHCMTYNPEADRIVSWGGAYGGSLWTYDFNTDTWEELPPGNGPEASYYCGCAYDEAAGLIILYGGSDSGSNETWTYDLHMNTWQQMAPVVNPGNLSRHNMVYDPESDRIILFGGQIEKAVFYYTDKTWFYNLNLNTWTEVGPGED